MRTSCSTRNIGKISFLILKLSAREPFIISSQKSVDTHIVSYTVSMLPIPILQTQVVLRSTDSHGNPGEGVGERMEGVGEGREGVGERREGGRGKDVYKMYIMALPRVI